MKKACIIKVSGKVQNVGFRFYTLRAAEDYRISGYVRNEPGGSVYIEAEGENDDLDGFAEWCRRGPQWARVDGFELLEQPLMGYKGFRVR